MNYSTISQNKQKFTFTQRSSILSDLENNHRLNTTRKHENISDNLF
jgi:hypothetical protein